MMIRKSRIALYTQCLFAVALLVVAGCVSSFDGPGDCIFAYEIVPGQVTVAVGDSVSVRAEPAAGCSAPATVTWRVDDGAKATVSSRGSLTAVVRGVAKGTTTINAENNDKSGFAIIVVN